MPTYEYECTKCSHRFEQFQSITAEPIKECPKCKRPTRRLIGTGAGVIFKGSGFYQTDYRSASYQKKVEAEKPKKPEPTQKDSPNIKSHPEAKPPRNPTGFGTALSLNRSDSRAKPKDPGRDSSRSLP